MLTFAFMHHPYLVCILFGMPSLHLFTFLMFFIFLLFTGLPLDPADCISLKELYHGSCIVVLNEVFMKKLAKPIRVHAYT